MVKPETVTTPVLTEEALKDLEEILAKARREEKEGLWEATENTSDLMAWLSNYGEKLLRLAEIGKRYERDDMIENAVITGIKGLKDILHRGDKDRKP